VCTIEKISPLEHGPPTSIPPANNTTRFAQTADVMAASWWRPPLWPRTRVQAIYYILYGSPRGVVKIRVSTFSETKTRFCTTKTCLKTTTKNTLGGTFYSRLYTEKMIIIAFAASARAVRREVCLPCFSYYYYSSRSTARGYRANTRVPIKSSIKYIVCCSCRTNLRELQKCKSFALLCYFSPFYVIPKNCRIFKWDRFPGSIILYYFTFLLFASFIDELAKMYKKRSSRISGQEAHPLSLAANDGTRLYIIL